MWEEGGAEGENEWGLVRRISPEYCNSQRHVGEKLGAGLAMVTTHEEGNRGALRG